MIDKKELRYGNFVTDNNDTLEVVAITKGHVGVNKVGATNAGFLNYEDIYPIPLTPELLEACGFEKDRNGWHMPETQFSLTDQFYPCWLDRMLWPQDLQEFKHLSLRYLHQLQNLFFALTNTELEVNLNKEKV